MVDALAAPPAVAAAVAAGGVAAGIGGMGIPSFL